MNITEQNLIDLGFVRNDVTEEQSGGSAYYYYSCDLLADVDGYAGISFLSNANDELNDDGYWRVELLESGHITIKDYDILLHFITSCKLVEENSK